MKILHISDLHLGKRLYHVDMLEDQLAFFSWLVKLVKKESVNGLLISGDIFDVANPSSESRKIYYEVLVKLSRLDCKVIITGGNHDSPSVLEAPGELLKEINVHVIGSLPGDLNDVIVEIPDQSGKTTLIVAAIPFLRDRDLIKIIENETYEDRLEAIKKGIARVYDKVARLCESRYPGIPGIAMGHLFMLNALMSDSERDIHIGNLAGIDGSTLPEYFSYFALGHLHKPQDIDKAGKIRYSGTPYPLSFSEKDNNNRVVLLTLNDGKISSESIVVPSNRKLIKYSGTLEEVRTMLNLFIGNNQGLTTLIEIEVIEENYDPGLLSELEMLPETFTAENAIIIKSRIQFKNKTGGTHELYSIEKQIEDLEPKEVFLKRLETESLSEESKDLLIEAFNEIYELIYEQE